MATLLVTKNDFDAMVKKEILPATLPPTLPGGP